MTQLQTSYRYKWRADRRLLIYQRRLLISTSSHALLCASISTTFPSSFVPSQFHCDIIPLSAYHNGIYLALTSAPPVDAPYQSSSSQTLIISTFSNPYQAHPNHAFSLHLQSLPERRTCTMAQTGRLARFQSQVNIHRLLCQAG